MKDMSLKEMQVLKHISKIKRSAYQLKFLTRYVQYTIRNIFYPSVFGSVKPDVSYLEED